MKRLLIVAVVGLIGLAGCNDRSPPGGPGASNTGSGNRTGITTPENAFRLDAPNLATTLKQGETKTVKIGIDRGKNFDQNVKLDFSGAPQGVKVTPAAGDLKASEKDVQVTIEAGKDAALGDHTITVTGTPAKDGKPTTTTFKIHVNEAG